MTGTGAGHELVVFMHIPKTAGTTMRAVLEATYGEAYLDTWIHSAAAPDGSPVTADCHAPEVDEVVATVEHAGSRVQCIGSNLPYGIHRRLNRPVSYLTFVRHPVDRCISRWYFAYRMRDERPMWRSYEAHGFDLERILDELVDYCLVDDQVRNITGLPVERPVPADLDRAIAMAARDYRFVGAMERFDDCLAHLRRELGWSKVGVEPRNVGDRSDPSLLPTDAAELFADANQLDAALHGWVVQSYLPPRLGPERRPGQPVPARATAVIGG